MIKEALQYIANLAVNSAEIQTKEINGETYIKGEAKRITPDYTDEINVNTLVAVVHYIKDCLNNESIEKPYIINVGHDSVTVKSGLNKYMKRNYLLYSKPLLPRIYFDRYMDMEEFIIMLKTNFVETQNLNNLIAIVSQITDEAKVEFKDDGFGMTVKQTKGVSVKKEFEMAVNPIVMLQPYRTFAEVEQPESRFLLRVKDGGQMALFEADGGMWKLSAQYKVSVYLRTALQDEIDKGTVVVVG